MAQSFRTFVMASIIILATAGVARVADAQPVNQEEMDKLMDVYRFGMTKAQILSALEAQISDRYDKKIFATSDVYQQDKLRRERDQEIERIKSSYVEFKGKTTGWDVSLIDDQFTHNTGESMLVSWEQIGGRNQRRFFFFQGGRMYKMVLALDTTMIDKEQRNFETFKGLMIRRYGTARELDDGLLWATKKYFLIAQDKLTHYDTLCLSISDPGLSRKVMKLRAQHERKEKKRSPIIRAMIDTTDEGPSLDEGANVIDNILKKE